jgi:hypothetical protein
MCNTLRNGTAAIVIAVVSVNFVSAANPGDNPLGFFSSSLHYTGEGMRYWYEADGGFMDITGIPYDSDQLDCKTCHVQSCDRCHAKKEDGKDVYSAHAAADMKAVCLSCHKREQAIFNMGQASQTLDVHIAKGMTCMDCHNASEVHGTGIAFHSMHDSGAVTTACENCHTFGEDASRAHTIHKGKLDCAACHVSNSIFCLNCHMDNVIKDQSRAGNFIPPKMDWTLLINYDGKVTAGSAQSLVYQNHKFIAYAPFFSHAVQAEGRECADCHANAAVTHIKQGQSIQMAAFKDGKVVSWQGVVPCVPDQLRWIFLNKTETGWVPIDDSAPVKYQMTVYGSPLTEDQIKKLAMPMKK